MSTDKLLRKKSVVTKFLREMANEEKSELVEMSLNDRNGGVKYQTAQKELKRSRSRRNAPVVPSAKEFSRSHVPSDRAIPYAFPQEIGKQTSSKSFNDCKWYFYIFDLIFCS